MNAGNLLNSKGAQLAIGAIVAGVVLYVITTKLGKAAVKAIENVNEGTPYEGTGPIGTLGHATDAVSGGLFSSIGGWLGRTAYDVFGDDYDPNAPTSSAPKVAPYMPRKSLLKTIN